LLEYWLNRGQIVPGGLLRFIVLDSQSAASFSARSINLPPNARIKAKDLFIERAESDNHPNERASAKVAVVVVHTPAMQATSINVKEIDSHLVNRNGSYKSAVRLVEEYLPEEHTTLVQGFLQEK
jgi:hypothetical protein